jgi:hypothetical protein
MAAVLPFGLSMSAGSGAGIGLGASGFNSFYPAARHLSRSNSSSSNKSKSKRHAHRGASDGLVAQCRRLMRRRPAVALSLAAAGLLLLLVLLAARDRSDIELSSDPASNNAEAAVQVLQQRKAALLHQWRVEAHAAHGHPPGYVEARERERALQEEAAEILVAAAASPEGSLLARMPSRSDSELTAVADSHGLARAHAPSQRSLLRGVSAALRRFGEKVQAGEEVLHVPTPSWPGANRAAEAQPTAPQRSADQLLEEVHVDDHAAAPLTHVAARTSDSLPRAATPIFIQAQPSPATVPELTALARPEAPHDIRVTTSMRRSARLPKDVLDKLRIQNPKPAIKQPTDF